jgi:alanyl-tRNA synthetase
VKQALLDTGRLLSVAPLEVPQRISALQADVATLEKQLAERMAAGPLSGERLLEASENVDGVTVVVTEVPGVEANLMRQLIDQVRGKAAPSAVLLASRQGDDKVTLVAGISKELQARKLSAGEWIRPVAAAVDGGGGGRADMAQAGGKSPAKLPEALQIAKETIRSMVAGA